MIARVAGDTATGGGVDEPPLEGAVGRLQDWILDADLIRDN
jgi:hypothetical protein